MAQNIGFLNFGIDGDDKAIKAKIDALKKDAVSLEQIFKNIKIDSEGSLSKDTQNAQLSADKLAISNAKVAQSISDMERASVRLSNEKARSAEIDSRTAVNSLRQATEKQRQDEVALNMEIRKQRVSNVTAESMARKAAIEQKMQEQSLMNEARLEGIRKRNEEIGKRGQENFRKAVEGANKSLQNQNSILTGLEKKLIGVFSTYQIARFAKEIVNVRGEFQGLELAFTTMLGSAEKSRKMMIDVTSMALESPYTVTEVASNTKQLIAMGIQAEKAMDTMKALGDVSAGLSVPMWRIAINYGQVSALGRLQAREIRDFAMAGVPIVEELAKQLGKTTGEITDLVSAGKIGFPEVEKAFQSMAGEGGKFHNMMEKQNSTVKGQMNRLQDQVELMMNSIGKSSEGIIYGTIDMASNLVENYEKVGRSIVGLIATYGAYRTAVVMASLSSRGYTLAEMARLGVMTTVNKVQKILNATMLNNPYVAVTALVVGAVSAFLALRDSTTEAERAQKRFNEKQEEASRLAEEHKVKIDSLIDSSRDIALTDIERGASLAELRKEYPKIFAQYDIETIKLADILDLKRQINAENKIKSEQENANELANIEKEITRYEKLFDSDGNESNLADYAKKIRDLKADRDVLLQELGKDISEQFIASFKDIKIDDFDKHIKILEEQIKGKGNNAKIKMRLPIDIEGTLSNEAIYDTSDIKNFIDALKTRKQSRLDNELNKTSNRQDLEEARKKIKEAEKAYKLIVDNNDKYSSKQREQAKQDLEKAKKDYEALGGILDITKLKKTVKKPKDIQSQKREEEDLAFQLAQAEIDADKKGSEKVIAQIKLNQKKELLALERNKEDYLKKKQAIAESIFESDSKNKDKKFDASSVTLSVDENQMFDNLKGVTNKKYSNELSAVYADLLTKYKGYTEKRLEALKKFQTDRENLVKAGASKESLDENKYQEEETLKAIDEQFAMREDSFQNWIDSIANIGIEKLREKLVEAKKELERMEFLTPNDPKLAIQRAKVDKLEKLTDKPELKTSPDKRSIKEWGDLYKVLNKVGRQFEEIGDSIGGTTGKILKGAGGISVATTQMVSSIIMVGKGSAEAMVGASTAAATAIKTVEKASVILAIIGAALQIATKITDMFAADYSKYEKAKENYESYVEVLDQVIDKQKELIETMTGDAAVKASQKAIELIEKQTEAAKALGKERLGAGASAGSHSIGIRQWKRIGYDLRDEAKKIIGYDFFDGKRMYGLFDLSVEQMAKLKEDSPEFWAKLDEDVRTYLDQIITGNTKIEEMKELLNESLTQTTFDGVYSEFLDMLMDMDVSAENFAENFSEYMMRAMLSNKVGTLFKGRIEDWYEDFTLRMKDGGLSPTDIEELGKTYSNIADEALELRDNLAKASGYDKKETSKSTLSKGIQGITENTGDLLASYVNAMRADVSVTKEQLLKIVQMAQYSQTSLGGMLAQLLLIQTNTLNTANNTKEIAGIVRETNDLLRSATTDGGITQFNVR